ncbi:MAG TPA: aminotransferase class V-fold PLP-dependent enzyme [Acidisarcina sp.]|nr:aminotransferase class V-fold PLP-dependent enzyme [Acidisarcina sp.]
MASNPTNPNPTRHIETLAVHAGQPVDSATSAVATPIYLSTTFERGVEGDYPRGFSYSRDDNPNRAALEKCVAAMEGGTRALAFPSGIAVASAVLQALRPGDHVLAPSDIYHGFRKAVSGVFDHMSLQVSYVDFSDAANVAAALRLNTRLIWMETPSNPLLKITDITAIVEIARKAGVTTVCDGTFATPVLQRPLDFGVDLVAHSTTKYFAGHSDVVGGVLICRKENAVFDHARRSQRLGGAVPSPFDCWLTLRGIATLPCRVRVQSASAQAIAEFLNRHASVELVFYPGLPSHPGHQTARRQMSMFGGVLSFLVKGGSEAAMRVAAATEILIRATSLGGTHSLIEHRASAEGPQSQTPQNLLRLSIGLENTEDLIADLDQALKRAKA